MAWVQVASTNSGSVAEEWEQTRPRNTTATTEVVNISYQCTPLLKEAVFNTMPGMVSVRRRVAAQTPSIYHQRQKELISSKIWWTNCLTHQYQASIESGSKNHLWRHPPQQWGKVHPEIGASYIKGKSDQLRVVKAPVYQSGSRAVIRPKTVKATDDRMMIAHHDRSGRT